MAIGETGLRLTDERDAVAATVIEDGLARFNESMAGYRDWQPLDVLVTKPGSNSVVGGLIGRTSLGLFFIDLVFVPEDQRRHGLGSRILETAEAEARARGCSTAVLFTITFQAPGFYRRHGYRETARIECRPPGCTRLCMTKTL